MNIVPARLQEFIEIDKQLSEKKQLPLKNPLAIELLGHIMVIYSNDEILNKQKLGAKLFEK